MGVPAFFRWVTKRYPGTLISVKDHSEEIESLYVDCNGVIHPCCHPEGKEQPSSEEEMLENIGKKLDELVAATKPTRLIYLACDGVAPRAKMNQQRKRRYCSDRESREIREIRDNLGLCPMKSAWDHNVITPGTPFMEKVSLFLKEWAELNVSSKVSVVVSDSNVPGEGEHKIVDHLRGSPTTAVIVGLDADLLFLSLALHRPQIYVLRDDTMKLLSLEKLAKSIRRIDDFVALCFLVGNDFLPQVPSLSIPDGGLDLLLEIHRRSGAQVAEGHRIRFDQLSIVLKLFAKVEAEVLRRQRPHFSSLKSQEDQVATALQNLAIERKNREIPLELGRKGYRRRYYSKILSPNFTERDVETLCANYARGLCFVSQYYHKGVQSWSWYYQHHYAPLAADLARVCKGVDTRFALGKPVSPLVQLMCVLPPHSECIPEDAREIMAESPDFPVDFDVDPHGKPASLTWLWIALLPFVDVDKLTRNLVEKKLLRKDEPNKRPYIVTVESGIGCARLLESNLAFSIYEFHHPPPLKAQSDDLTLCVDEKLSRRKFPISQQTLDSLFLVQPQKTTQQPCRFWARGCCTRGQSCKFAHPQYQQQAPTCHYDTHSTSSQHSYHYYARPSTLYVPPPRPPP